jgi:trehalose 6-phosphate synthase/phosphatase
LRKPQNAGQGYFSRQPDSANSEHSQPSPTSPLVGRIPLKSSLSQIQHGEVALSGTVLSATFTLPQTLQHHKGGKWVITLKKHEHIGGKYG